jgi:hypothetical protein
MPWNLHEQMRCLQAWCTKRFGKHLGLSCWNGPLWRSALMLFKSFYYIIKWLAIWRRDLEGCEAVLSVTAPVKLLVECSQLSDLNYTMWIRRTPQHSPDSEFWKIQNGCFKSLSLAVSSYIATDNWNHFLIQEVCVEEMFIKIPHSCFGS